MYELLNKLDYIIKSYDYNINKIENYIKCNDLYNNLDTDEKELIMEYIIDKIDNKNIKPDIIKHEKKQEFKQEKKQEFKPEFKPLYKKIYYPKEQAEVIMVENNGKMISEGEIMSSITTAKILNELSDDEYNKRKLIFEKLKSIILPAQRSQEWFDARHKKITGSDAGCVLNMNKHEPQFNFIIKKVLGSTFEGNQACYHGKKFEQVVTMMYELENNVITEEFGLLPHDTIDILAASPDGICTPFCRDGVTKSHLVGRMLEIKCPTMRKIKYTGNIKDTICPIYYWCQIQQQMECCNLDECDFVQCNIQEYNSRQEWINDTDPNCDYKSQKYGLFRGVLIELLPSKFDSSDYKDDGSFADLTIWNKTSFLYPPKIDMSNAELDNWILTSIDKLDKKFIVNRVIYWKLLEKNCTLILRDKNWFFSQMPTYEKIWNYVLYLREHLDVIEEWKNWIDNLPRKFNDKVFQKLDELVQIKENSKNINHIKNDEQLINVDNKEDKVEKIKRKYVKKFKENI